MLRTKFREEIGSLVLEKMLLKVFVYRICTRRPPSWSCDRHHVII